MIMTVKKQQEHEEKMDPENDKKQIIEESDRLSSLPDDLIHKILSFNGTKDVIKTSCLSSRWRFIWTTMPCLTFSGEDYTIIEFSEVVKHVLSGRDNQRGVTSARLSLRGNDSLVFVKRILDYAFSHNVQQLNITSSYGSNVFFPLSLLSSQSLKHLTIKTCCCKGLDCDHTPGVCDYWKKERTGVTLTSKWKVPALTTLHLDGTKLSHVNLDNFSGLISACVNLKNLTLRFCKIMESSFDICHPQLSKLIINNLSGNVRDVRVLSIDTPQLRNLNIRHFLGRSIIVSAPDLAHLSLECYHGLNLSADDFRSLETVDISISHPSQEPQELFGLLQRLHSVKFLTLNMEILEILSSSVELLSHQHSPFANLKRLKIYPLDLSKKVDSAIEVKNFILNNSPNATFVMVSREEALTEENAKIAKRYMDNLRVLLEICMADINSCWGCLSEQIEQGKTMIYHILDWLRTIKFYMRELPASHRAEMQSSFSCLCAEANVVMSKITDCIKTQFDEYLSSVNAHFHELATPL